MGAKMKNLKRVIDHCLGLVAVFLLVAAGVISPAAVADQIPAGAFAHNLEAVGYSDLAGRPGFKMSIREVGGRWYLYLGHFWHSGWSIVDVTKPADPRLVRFIPGPENTWTLQVDIAGDTMITALEQISPGWGGDPNKPNDEGVLIWNLSDPVNPKKLGQFRTGGEGTHRNGYPGGRYMHLAAGMPGYEGNIYLIVDISDPARPVEAGRWWIPGQHVAGGEKSLRAPGAPKTSAPSLHGPVEVRGNLAFLPYGSGGLVTLDISDVSHPKLVSRLDFKPPFNDAITVHTIVPDMERKVAFVNSEAIRNQCKEPLNHASVVDLSNPAQPMLVSIFPLPTLPVGYPQRDFCDVGGRFGPHNQHQLFHNPSVQPLGNLIYMTYFNAGLRVFDVADVRQPKEAGYFIPPHPTRRFGPVPADRLVVQTEDVLVDKRGYIYITHKNQGLWILRYTPEPMTRPRQ